MKYFVKPSPRYFVSVGGAYLRVWAVGRGLLAEVPTCAVVDKTTGELKLIGQEAAALEGKVPPHFAFIRPFFADKIVDRYLLLELANHLLLQAAEGSWRQRFSLLSQSTLIIPETVSQLHRRWLLRSMRDAGWWLITDTPLAGGFSQSRQPASSTQSFSVNTNQSLLGILDIGFSAARLIVVLPNQTVVLANHQPGLSLQALVVRLTEQLLAKQNIELSPSVFYSQLWFQTRFAYNHQTDSSQEFTLSPKFFGQVLQEYRQDLNRFVQKSINTLSPNQRNELFKNGLQIVGGGADLLFSSDFDNNFDANANQPTKSATGRAAVVKSTARVPPYKSSKDTKYTILRSLAKSTEK